MSSHHHNFPTADFVPGNLNAGSLRLLGDTQQRWLARAAFFVACHWSRPPFDQPAQPCTLTPFADKYPFDWLRQQFVEPSADDVDDQRLGQCFGFNRFVLARFQCRPFGQYSLARTLAVFLKAFVLLDNDSEGRVPRPGRG